MARINCSPKPVELTAQQVRKDLRITGRGRENKRFKIQILFSDEEFTGLSVAPFPQLSTGIGMGHCGVIPDKRSFLLYQCGPVEELL